MINLSNVIHKNMSNQSINHARAAQERQDKDNNCFASVIGGLIFFTAITVILLFIGDLG
jgi:hypothetical protein